MVMELKELYKKADYRDNRGMLFNTDCLSLLPQLGGASVDMILCDLPYGTTRNKWDSIVPLEALWEQYKRIIKPNGAVVLFAQSPFDKVLACSALDWFKYEWIWVKDNGTGFLNAKKAPLKIHENILVFYKKPPTYNPQMREGKPYVAKAGRKSSNYGTQSDVTTVNTGERYPIDVVNFNRDKGGLHPTQKPVALLEYLIKTYTNENEIVLDNTMGSGSTCVAAKRTGRRYIGIESEKGYFDIAKERLQNEISAT